VCVCVYDSAELRVYWRSELELEQQETKKKVFISSYLSWDWKHVGSFSLFFFIIQKTTRMFQLILIWITRLCLETEISSCEFLFSISLSFHFYFFIFIFSFEWYLCASFFPPFSFYFTFLIDVSSLLMWEYFFLSPHITPPLRFILLA
jgi:hypothetical protein